MSGMRRRFAGSDYVASVDPVNKDTGSPTGYALRLLVEPERRAATPASDWQASESATRTA